MPSSSLVVVVCLALAGCGDDSTMDLDSGPEPDGGTVDAGPPADAGAPDTGPPADAGGTGDTWSTFAMDWFATYCTECHNIGGATRREYRTIDDVVRDQATIRCGVAPTMLDGCTGSPSPGQFPIGTGPFPDDASRNRLVAWIDDGLPE